MFYDHKIFAKSLKVTASIHGCHEPVLAGIVEGEQAFRRYE
jgi:hypothetical protein